MSKKQHQKHRHEQICSTGTSGSAIRPTFRQAVSVTQTILEECNYNNISLAHIGISLLEVHTLLNCLHHFIFYCFILARISYSTPTAWYTVSKHRINSQKLMITYTNKNTDTEEY